MPDTVENEIPVSPAVPKKRSERTEAKFYEDGNKLIAESENVAAGVYQPPNPIAAIASLQSKRDASLAQRVLKQADETAEETERNARENLYKPMDKEITSLVGFARSAGKQANEIHALETISRKIKGIRAEAIKEDDTNRHVSVSNRAYVSRADNYTRFVEQYAALEIATDDKFYQPANLRTKAAAYQEANNRVITAEAKANASQTLYDQITYTNEDSYLNACVSSKEYFKSKFKATHYKNIAKMPFELPTRLRKK